ncbi:hypothetical protein [Nocardia sp. NPDC060259]|uniref:hypothetical protein n=1 Tax=Nocardia sp. NPDC060259 TaxID=3347088 RepID=UPI00364F23BF
MSTQIPTAVGCAAVLVVGRADVVVDGVVVVGRTVLVIGGFVVVAARCDGASVPHPADTSAIATTAGKVQDTLRDFMIRARRRSPLDASLTLSPSMRYRTRRS